MKEIKKSFFEKHSMAISIFAPLLLVSLVATAIVSHRYFSFKNKITSSLKNIVEKKATNAVVKINKEFEEITQIANKFADVLSKTGATDKTKIEKDLQNILQKNPGLYGAGIAFEPFAFKENTKLYAPYAIRKQNWEIKIEQIEKTYDYTIPKKSAGFPETDWYLKPIKSGAMWSEPYFATTSNTIIVEYEVPFYAPKDKEKKQPIGIIFLNYNLNQIKRIVTSLNLKQAGYGFIISPKGIFINHPIEKFYLEQNNISNIEKEFDEKKLSEITEKLIKEKSYTIDKYDEFSKRNCLITFQLIPATKWLLVSVDFKDEMFGIYAKQFRQNEIIISLSLLIFLIILFIFIACCLRKNLNIVWGCSIVITLFLSAEIFHIWNLAFTKNVREIVESEIIVGNSDLNNFIKQYKGQSSIFRKLPKTYFIPTGLLVRNITFSDINHISLVGYVWQKYDNDLPKDLKKGFFFPQSTQTVKDEAYQHDKNGTIIIGWNFKCIISQSLQYSSYPLDYKNLIVKISPSDHEHNIILIPDFDSYTLITPQSLPGIQPHTILKGWNLEQSFFSYKKPEFETSLGLKKITPTALPQLEFNTVIKRKFLQPFVSRMLPLIVALVLLFITLMIIRKKSFFVILSIIAGIFFSLVLAQISLRTFLPTQEFFYLEYFYYVAYLMMTGIIINLTFHLRVKKELRQEKDNLLAKLFYWPILLSVLLVLTVYTFY